MKIIKPSYEILTLINGKEILQHIEKVGRTCYKTEEKITDDSCYAFAEMLIKRGHEAMIEFGNIAVRFVACRGFTHEMVRHRPVSYAQESTRYCNYSKDKFGKEITVILPYWSYYEGDLNSIAKHKTEWVWVNAMQNAEKSYFKLLDKGLKPQDARGVLPIDVKTEICVSCNIREWRHIFKLRCASVAHPSMIELMRPLCTELKNKIPVVFDDIEY